jgi:hypothetical protein
VKKCFCLIAQHEELFRLQVQSNSWLAAEEMTMTKIEQRPIRSGDKVVRDSATQNPGTVHLGEAAPIFRPSK